VVVLGKKTRLLFNISRRLCDFIIIVGFIIVANIDRSAAESARYQAGTQFTFCKSIAP
jgi:hypothetical protein